MHNRAQNETHNRWTVVTLTHAQEMNKKKKNDKNTQVHVHETLTEKKKSSVHVKRRSEKLNNSSKRSLI